MKEKGSEKKSSETSQDGGTEITNFSATVYDRPVFAGNILNFPQSDWRTSC